MITLKYHLVDSKLRKQVDLRDYTKELEDAVEKYPVRLDKVNKDFYQITIMSDTKKNKIVRDLGRQIAKTSLKVLARKKKGANSSYELFIQKKH